MDNQQPSLDSNIFEGSETIPSGSTPEMGEKVAKFYFYVLIDPRNYNISYIGRTVDPQNRYRNHIYEAKKNNRNKRERWIFKLLKLNLKPIMKVILEKITTLKDAIEIEKYLVIKYSEIYNLKNSPDNYLGAVLTGNKVYKYDLNCNYICSYMNSNQAYIQTKIKDSSILKCCKNQTKSAGGFLWSFNKYKKYPYKYNNDWRKDKGKPVLQYDLNMNFIREWKTAKDVFNNLNISYKNISSCCLNKRKNAGKFIWKFKT